MNQTPEDLQLFCVVEVWPGNHELVDVIIPRQEVLHGDGNLRKVGELGLGPTKQKQQRAGGALVFGLGRELLL